MDKFDKETQYETTDKGCYGRDMKLPASRFYILIVASICLTSILSNMATYNFTKICINPDKNSTKHYHGKEHHFTKYEQSWLQAAVAIGALAASVPYTLLFQRYEHRFVFLSAGVISGISTALVPLANDGGFGYFLVARAFQGVAFSATFPIIGAITADWATLHEHGLFIALLTACTQLSNIFTMPVSGALCTSDWGWPSVYYLHASISLVAFTMWTLFYRDTPETHPLTSKGEIEKIRSGKHDEVRESRVPYTKILKSKTIWAVWVAAFGDLLSVQLVSMFNPQYMKDYLQYDVMTTGFLAALPIIVQFVVKMIGGISSDMIKSIDETLKLRIYNSLALWLSAVFFIALAFVPQDKHITAIVILIIAESLIGFNTAGFNKCATLHSRQYGHFVMTQIMNLWAVTILLEPFIVNSIVQENSFPDWRNCFLVHAVVLILSNVLFLFWADAKPAKWTKNEDLISRSSFESNK